MTGWNKFGRENGETGKRGTSGKGDCHRASSRNLNASMDGVFKISSGSLFQYGTIRTLNACFTPLLVNLENMTSKPNAGGGSKN